VKHLLPYTYGSDLLVFLAALTKLSPQHKTIPSPTLWRKLRMEELLLMKVLLLKLLLLLVNLWKVLLMLLLLLVEEVVELWIGSGDWPQAIGGFETFALRRFDLVFTEESVSRRLRAEERENGKEF
jgi:hypothetical protein